MTNLMPLPGRPDALKGYTGRYADIAEQLRSASKVLQLIANDEEMIGKAISAVRARVSEASSAILAAEPRYTETSTALAEYAVRLEIAQEDAADAIRRLGSDADELEDLEAERGRLQWRLATMLAMSPTAISDLQDEIRALDRQIGPLESSVDSATAAYRQAVEDRDAAAYAAIIRIHDVLDRNGDSIWDTLWGAWDDLTGGLADIADWIWNVALPVIIDVILVIELLAVVLNPITLGLLLAGLTGFVLGSLLGGKDFDAIIDDLISGASEVLPQVSIGLQLLLLREALTATPPIDPLTPPGGLTSQSREPYYSNLFLENAERDAKGGTDSTQVEIVEVIDENGNSSWRVILPSTQDWEAMNGVMDGAPDPATDQGALNDLGSNLALMLTPAQEAAYQRMVKQAMLDAGIGPNDPVMLVGWSQGGILAGRMACSDDTPGEIQAIVVAGAPIDAMQIPSGVSVLSIQHPGDVVPMLDGQSAAPNSYTDDRRWATIDGNYTGMEAHNAEKYATSAAANIDTPTSGNGGPPPAEYRDPVVQQIVADQAQFFGDDERVNIYEATG